jgi:hypothetical protein
MHNKHNSSNKCKNSADLKSVNSMGSHRERKYDTIPFRIEFIKELLDGKKLDPMVNFNSCETDNFINPSGFRNVDSGGSVDYDDHSNDTRHILNKKLHDFYKVIHQIGGKLLYVKSGTTGHTFKGIVKGGNGNNVNYGVKVVAYRKREKYGDMYDVRRPENAELMMIRLLSYFVVKRQTPHIVLPIGTFNTSIKPFINLINDGAVEKENKKYQEFIENYSKNQYYSNVSILISEWANRGDLLDFIRKNYKEFTLIHWKVFFFQILSVLAVIHCKYPSFRHNDLKANNVLVHKIKQRGTKFSYTVNRCHYIVPSVGYQLKIWDFDFACIPGLVDNAKVNAEWTDKINVKASKNRYYDMHYFFNTLIKRGFFPQFMTEKNIPKEAQDFVNRVVPPMYQNGKHVHKRGRILVDTEYLIPDMVLKKDEFFEEFRNVKHKSRSVKKKY